MRYTRDLVDDTDEGDMARTFWPCATTLLFVVLLGLGTGRAISQAYVLRFSDSLPMPDPSGTQQTPFVVLPEHAPVAPAVSAHSWLKRNGWKQVWPLPLLGAGPPLFFAGPSTQRYLRLSADDDYYIWTQQLDIDPHAQPM